MAGIIYCCLVIKPSSSSLIYLVILNLIASFNKCDYSNKGNHTISPMSQSIVVENVIKDDPPAYSSLNPTKKSTQITIDNKMSSPLPPSYLTYIV